MAIARSATPKRLANLRFGARSPITAGTLWTCPSTRTRVAVTIGASGAFVLSFLAAFDVGDRVVVPEPAFPAYRNILKALGVEVVPLSLGPETDFKPTIGQMLAAIEGPVHGLVIASPANPTGTMLSRRRTFGRSRQLLRHQRHPSDFR